VNRRNRHKTRFGKRDQSFRDQFGGHLRLFQIGGFLQIEPGAKRCARATQNQDTLARFVRGDPDRSDQFIQQLDC